MSSSGSSSSSGEIKGKRKLWNIQTDFVSTPIFQNTLPSAPSGPFFKKIPIDNFSKYSTFDVSSLEKSYIWQPHFPDAGVKLDLVDQESILIPNKVPPLDPMDAKYMQTTSVDSSKSKLFIARRSALVTDVGDKPWWLRATVYIENNLYNQPIIKNKEVAPIQNTNLETPFNITAIEESFYKIKNIDNYIDKARKVKLGRKTSNIKVEWSIPLFPDISTLMTNKGSNNSNMSSSYEKPSIPVRFDEDIETLVKNKKIKKNNSHRNNTEDNDNGDDETAAIDTAATADGDVGNNPSDEELNVLYSIITNLRHRENKEAVIVNDKSLNISLIAPSTTTTRNYKQPLQHHNSHPQSSLSSQNEHSSSSSIISNGDMAKDENSTIYHWVSDFKMDITTSATHGDEFLMKLTGNTHNSHVHNNSTTNSSNNNSSSTVNITKAEYWPVKSRIEVHKLPAEEWNPHDAVVHRLPAGSRAGGLVGGSSGTTRH